MTDLHYLYSALKYAVLQSIGGWGVLILDGSKFELLLLYKNPSTFMGDSKDKGLQKVANYCYMFIFLGRS